MGECDAAVAIVHARATNSVLLIRRAERAEDPWSGHWSFPGGRRDPEDIDSVHNALRELEEECGIRLRREELEATLVPATARRRVGAFLQVAPFVFRVDDEQPVTLDPAEAAEARWISLAVMQDPARHSLFPAPGLPSEVRFPGIDLDGVPLWGFTYRLITEWLGLNPRGEPLEHSGFDAACALLDGIVANGCALLEGWSNHNGTCCATVSGTIPVDRVWAIGMEPRTHIPRLNMLEVRPDQVRLVGLAFEEYVVKGKRLTSP